MTALALAVYGLLIAATAVVVFRRPIVALYVFVLGLPLHNIVMSLLYGGGIRGHALDAIQAWKEIVLAAALASVAVAAVRARRLPFRPQLVDWLALAYAAVVLLYAVIPQSALDGHAGARAIAYGLRHDLVLVAAYFLGRSLPLDVPRVRWLIAGAAAAVAAWGLIEVYSVPIEWWRHSGAVGYFHRELGYDYHGPGGLPENFAFNTSDGLFRRLVSTFVSPLATAYLLVVALLLLATFRRVRPACGRARGGLRRRAAVDVFAIVDRRARDRTARARRGPPPLVAGGRRGRRRRRRLRLRGDLPRHRAPNALVRERPSVPAGAGAGERAAAGGQRPVRNGEPGRALDQEPPRLAARRDPDGAPPPAGLRARERGDDRAALRREAEGRRVELHRARSRRPGWPARCCSSPGASRCSSVSSAPPGRAICSRPGSAAALTATLALAVQTDVDRRALARILPLVARRSPCLSTRTKGAETDGATIRRELTSWVEWPARTRAKPKARRSRSSGRPCCSASHPE